MPTVSLSHLPISRTGGWPNDKKIPASVEPPRNNIDDSASFMRALEDWQFDQNRTGAREKYLRGVFSPPMDIEPIIGEID